MDTIEMDKINAIASKVAAAHLGIRRRVGC
jgi:hypothetical protein